MKATLISKTGEVSIENPHELRIQVAPEGEDIGPFEIHIHGGLLTISHPKGEPEKPALNIGYNTGVTIENGPSTQTHE